MVKLDKKIGDKKMSFFFLNAKISILKKKSPSGNISPIRKTLVGS
jgi:hypothetical protein